jgi:hypothetical protein
VEKYTFHFFHATPIKCGFVGVNLEQKKFSGSAQCDMKEKLINTKHSVGWHWQTRPIATIQMIFWRQKFVISHTSNKTFTAPENLAESIPSENLGN